MTFEQQQVDHAAANFAESLKSVGYQACTAATVPDYSTSSDLWQPSNAVQVQVADVEYWNPATDSYQDTCPGTDGGTQRLTVRAEWGERDRQAQIVKRNR